MTGPGVVGSACRTLPTHRLAGMRLTVTPATTLRWHRDVVPPPLGSPAAARPFGLAAGAP